MAFRDRRLLREQSNGSICFVTLGSFEPRKGQDVLLEAIHKLDPEIRAPKLFQDGWPGLGR